MLYNENFNKIEPKLEFKQPLISKVNVNITHLMILEFLRKGYQP